MPNRVQEILLVASMYDAFTLEEGGRLTELLLSEYRELNLSFAPRITKASSGREAIELGALDIIEKPADLNILTQKIEEARSRKEKK